MWSCSGEFREETGSADDGADTASPSVACFRLLAGDTGSSMLLNVSVLLGIASPFPRRYTASYVQSIRKPVQVRHGLVPVQRSFRLRYGQQRMEPLVNKAHTLGDGEGSDKAVFDALPEKRNDGWR